MKTKLKALRKGILVLGTGSWVMSLFLIFVSCNSSRDISKTQNFEELIQLIDSRNFEIQHDWANPLAGSMINLLGNPNYIRFKGDSIEVFLPYYGVRHTGGGYNAEGGINFNGIPKNLSIINEIDKKRFILEFSGNMDSEDLDFLIIVYNDGAINTSVNSSQRNMISYRGKVRSLPND